MTQPARILHIIEQKRWEQARTTAHVTDPSLQAEGFIHCSTTDQVLIPANERFAGRTDLLLLVIDLAAVASDTVFEDCYESGLAFPHIYGPIPTDAIIDVVAFPPNSDGTFDLPPELASP